MEQIIKILKALSDETRLRVFLLISKEELCVCELSNILKMEQSRLSHCLRILKNADLARCKRSGKWKIYFSNPAMGKKSIIEYLRKEAILPKHDEKNLIKCKRDKVREKCKSG